MSIFHPSKVACKFITITFTQLQPTFFQAFVNFILFLYSIIFACRCFTCRLFIKFLMLIFLCSQHFHQLPSFLYESFMKQFVFNYYGCFKVDPDCSFDRSKVIFIFATFVRFYNISSIYNDSFLPQCFYNAKAIPKAPFILQSPHLNNFLFFIFFLPHTHFSSGYHTCGAPSTLIVYATLDQC